MAARSSHNSNGNGAAPLPVSALPLPTDQATTGEDEATQSLPTGSSGKLTPAQRARLGLDIYGDDQPAQRPAAPTPAEQPASDFGFVQMDPRTQAQPAASEPKLAPVQDAPKLAPVRQVNGRVTRDDGPLAPRPDPPDNANAEAGSRGKQREQSVSDRDGIPEVERDRSILGYGVGWTVFCLLVAVVVSGANVSADADGINPSAFVPALVSIALGWIVVAIGYRVRAWGWFMIVPAVVLVLGPFVFTSWQVGKVESSARAFLSPAGASAVIDIDSASILSSTINTAQGCFAMLKDRSNGDVRVDVVTYVPQTAQQQAAMALAPRYARRVQAGGARVAQRSFTLPGGNPPPVVIVQTAPPIDCANSTGP